MPDQSPLRGRSLRPKSNGQRQTRDQTFHSGRRCRPATGRGQRPSEPARLPAAGTNLGPTQGPGPTAGNHVRPPRRRLRLRRHPHPARRAGPAGRHRAQRAARTCPGHQTLAGRTHPRRHNNFYKLARCTERRQIVADFYIALANTVVLVRRLLRRAWSLYRWDTRPRRRP